MFWWCHVLICPAGTTWTPRLGVFFSGRRQHFRYLALKARRNHWAHPTGTQRRSALFSGLPRPRLGWCLGSRRLCADLLSVVWQTRACKFTCVHRFSPLISSGSLPPQFRPPCMHPCPPGPSTTLAKVPACRGLSSPRNATLRHPSRLHPPQRDRPAVPACQ